MVCYFRIKRCTAEHKTFIGFGLINIYDARKSNGRYFVAIFCFLPQNLCRILKTHADPEKTIL